MQNKDVDGDADKRLGFIMLRYSQQQHWWKGFMEQRSHTMWQAASKGFYDIYLIKYVKCTLNTGFL